MVPRVKGVSASSAGAFLFFVRLIAEPVDDVVAARLGLVLGGIVVDRLFVLLPCNEVRAGRSD